jgi:hypothetical protein
MKELKTKDILEITGSEETLKEYYGMLVNA